MIEPPYPDQYPEPRGRCYDMYDSYEAVREELDKAIAYIEWLKTQHDPEYYEADGLHLPSQAGDMVLDELGRVVLPAGASSAGEEPFPEEKRARRFDR